MVLGTAAFCRDANVRNPGVFRAKVRGQNVDLADGFQRGLAGRRFSEDAAVGTLAVDRETSSIALCPEKLEFTVSGLWSDPRY